MMEAWVPRLGSARAQQVEASWPVQGWGQASLPFKQPCSSVQGSPTVPPAGGAPPGLESGPEDPPPGTAGFQESRTSFGKPYGESAHAGGLYGTLAPEGRAPAAWLAWGSEARAPHRCGGDWFLPSGDGQARTEGLTGTGEGRQPTCQEVRRTRQEFATVYALK